MSYKITTRKYENLIQWIMETKKGLDNEQIIADFNNDSASYHHISEQLDLLSNFCYQINEAIGVSSKPYKPFKTTVNNHNREENEEEREHATH